MATATSLFLALSLTAALPSAAQAFTSLEEMFGTNLFSVTQADFHATPCKPRVPSIEAIEEYLDTFANRNLIRATRGGIRLVNQPRALVNALGGLVKRPNDILFRQLNLRNSFDIPAGCDEVVCVVSAVWGRELGLKLLYMKLKHGFNGSELAMKNAQRFTISEINHALAALAALPEKMHLGSGVNPRGIVSSTTVRQGAAADASPINGIRLFSDWRGDKLTYKPLDWMEYVQESSIVHELGHLRGFRVGGHNSPAWRALTPGCQVSTYGKTNHKEDFAEAFRAYRYNGATLQQFCPEKYAFMKRVFYGREYTDPYSCI